MGFSTPAAYPRPVSEGGGGGRFFTGAHNDAIGCASCHEPAGTFDVEVDGMPAVYSPGTTLTVVATWPRTDRTVSVVAEWVDADGEPVGDVRLAPPEVVEEADRCASGSVAASRYETEDGRQIIGMPACGATRLRMQWTGPDTLDTAVSLHLGAVASDDSDDPWDDWVQQRAVPMDTAGARAPSGCTSAPQAPGSSAWLLLAVLCTIRRRR